MRRARRLPAPALGALTAALVVAASWPAAASAGIHGPGPGQALGPAPTAAPAAATTAAPGPASAAQPWLLGRAAPAMLNLPPAADAPAVTVAKVAPLRHVLP